MKISVKTKILIAVVALALVTAKFSGGTSSAPRESKDLYLGLTVAEFRAAYDKKVEENRSHELRIVESKKSHADGRYSVAFYTRPREGDTVTIYIETDETQTLMKGIAVTCKPDGYSQEELVFHPAVLAYTFVISILNPSSPNDTCNEVFNHLSLAHERSSVSIGGISYVSNFKGGYLTLGVIPNK